MSRKRGFYNRLAGRHVGLIIPFTAYCDILIFQLGPQVALASSNNIAIKSLVVVSGEVWAFAGRTNNREQDLWDHLPAASAAALAYMLVQSGGPRLLVRSRVAVGMPARLAPVMCLAGVLSFHNSFPTRQRDAKCRIHVPDENLTDWLEKPT